MKSIALIKGMRFIGQIKCRCRSVGRNTIPRKQCFVTEGCRVKGTLDTIVSFVVKSIGRLIQTRSVV